MGGFILGVIVVLIIWAFFSAKSKANSIKGFNGLDEAKIWLNKQGIVFSSVIFSSYNDPCITKNTGATVLVGIGKKVNGDRVGFAIEVKQNCGVLSSLIIEPEGIASHHSKAAHIAKMDGKYLIDTLNQMAIQHRIEHGLYK